MTFCNPHKYKTKSMPTSVFGNGVVMAPIALLAEIDKLRGQGLTINEENLKISDRAHLVMPWHPKLDQRREKLLGAKAIGTTGRGIGPAYAEKVERRGFRFIDLDDPLSLAEKLAERVEEIANYLVKDFDITW